MNWFLLVIISAVTASLTRVLQKVLLTDKNTNPVAFAFVLGSLSSLFMLAWALMEGFIFPDLGPLLPNLLAMALLYCLANILLYNALKLAEASEVSILLASSTIWAVLSAVIMLNERLTPVKLVATLLVFLGVAVVYYSKSKWQFNRGHFFALLSGLCVGIAFTNDNFIVGHFQNVSSYMFIAFLLPSVAILLFDPKAIGQLKYFCQKDILTKLLLAGLAWGISAIAIYQAYKNGGEVSVISPIFQTSVLMTVAISYVFLKERGRLANKITGALLVLAGVWLLR